MFERNPVDNRTEMLIAVDVSLADGSRLSGRTALAAGKSVNKLLDSDGAFVYVETFDADGVFVPKGDIRGIRVINSGRSTGHRLNVPDARHFDPYRVLGLEKGASFHDVRASYVALAKAYHPDRYAAVELPVEVKGYLEAMFKSVNAAFEALKFLEHKAAPVYQRGV